MTGRNILKLIGCIVLPLVVGGISGFLTTSAITGWYATLTKPAFNPPNYLFGPVWTALYILMGISFYLILNSPEGKYRSRAIIIFGLQLFLNFWWSVIFFSFRHIDYAMMEIILLWVAIVAMLVSFYRVKPVAAYLQIPYLLWVTFASALNLAILLLN